MSVEILLNLLFWCAVINYGVLIVWFVAITLAHDWLYRLHGRWFRFSLEQFDALNYALMGLFKIGILLFNLAPYVALRIAT